MRYFVANQIGRFVVVHLRKGERILDAVNQTIADLGIVTGAVISGIGSLRKADFHAIASLADKPNDEFFHTDAPIELGSLQGLIIEGKPHLHMVFSDKEKTVAAHLEPDTQVQYLAEIAILELKDLNVVRRLDEMGVSYITEGEGDK